VGVAVWDESASVDSPGSGAILVIVAVLVANCQRDRGVTLPLCGIVSELLLGQVTRRMFDPSLLEI